MVPTRVVHFKKSPYDVYIGRPASGGHEHYGNPFTHKANTQADIVLPTRKEAIAAYRAWLLGEAYPEVNPLQRQWILAHMQELQGKRLGCWCSPQKCHGDALVSLLDVSLQPPTPPSQEQLNLL